MMRRALVASPTPPAQAAADLALAYPAGLSTHDMPVLADVGLAVAALALVRVEPAEAAAILGATARVRGSADGTDPLVIRLTASLRERLGRAYDAAYEAGWSLDPAAAVARLDPARLEAAVPQARRA